MPCGATMQRSDDVQELLQDHLPSERQHVVHVFRLGDAEYLARSSCPTRRLFRRSQGVPHGHACEQD